MISFAGHLSYQNNRHHWACDEDQMTGHGRWSPRVEDLPGGGQRYRLMCFPEGTASLGLLQLRMPYPYTPEDRIFCNGFQSWSESRLFTFAERLPRLRRLARPFMGYYGDDHFAFIRRGKGYLHSWSWTHWQQPDGQVWLLASLNDHQAFTCFQHDLHHGELVITPDCEGLEISGSFAALDLIWIPGTLAEVYDRWFAWLKIEPPRAPQATGYTSWYRHYTDLSEAKVRQDLAAWQETGRSLDFFQIDDGYQTAVGDWLSPKPSFPEGLAPVSAAIRSAGFRPGLWLAPTVADTRSRLLREHPEWVVRNARGRPLRAGYNPLWKGWFYALDVTHPGWQAYMEKVFGETLDRWGFSLLKLDFLYAACIFPQPRFTRAQLMHRTLQLFRSWAGDRYLLGCGMPLAPGFGLVDYCRVGPDIHLHWEHGLLRWLRHRERVSTHLALRTVIGRWPLAGRAWRNDPDVFLLRDEGLGLSRTERQTILRVNALLGELLFSSDDPSAYGEWQQAQWTAGLTEKNYRATAVEPVGMDQFAILAPQGECLVNLDDRPHTLRRNGQPYLLPPRASLWRSGE
jgi:alpha-galactosidase